MSKLYLIPNSISDQTNVLPTYLSQVIAKLRIFFVEEAKSARALLKQLDPNFPLQACRFFDLNEHTKNTQTQEYLSILKQEDGGIISESGCPCVADPGADLVLLAHHNQIEIIPLVGPSSIIMALMASGLGGQNFAFNGYLAKDISDRQQKLKMLELRSHKEHQTQIFMDTPYRNQNIFEDCMNVLNDQTLLCIACDISGTEEWIKTLSIKEWKKTKVAIPKKPALFLIQKNI